MQLDAPPVVKVDDALLALCNEAYGSADARGASEVAVADLVWCLACAPRWSAEIVRHGIVPARLARSAELAMSSRASRNRIPGRIATSIDLKTLLLRAERRALDAGKPAADVSDFVHVLFRESQDVADAHFVRTAVDPPRTSAPREPRWQNAADLAPPRSYFRESTDSDSQALSTRVATQERQHIELAARCDRLTEQVQSLSRALAERSATEASSRTDLLGLMRRLEAQDRRVAELQQLNDALAHRLTAVLARAGQATEAARAQEAVLADILARLRETESAQSRRDARSRSRRLSARARRRRARRLRLRMRLRQRRTISRRSGWRRRTLAPKAAVGLHGRPSRRADPAAHVAPRLAYAAIATDTFEPLPRAFIEDQPPLPPKDLASERDLADEMAEPIESEDDGDLDGPIGDRPKRFYLTLDDDVERAPSIGPRTAERLSAQGVATVRDLLTCDPQALALRVQSRYVSAERVAAWKSQARLVCTVPWLRGTHAQLLVGAGYDTLDKLERASTSDVCAGIVRYAGTRDGQSVLRAGPPPAPERIAAWMGHVMLAEPERARSAA